MHLNPLYCIHIVGSVKSHKILLMKICAYAVAMVVITKQHLFSKHVFSVSQVLPPVSYEIDLQALLLILKKSI